MCLSEQRTNLRRPRRVSQTGREYARLRLRDAVDGYCGINHAVQMARYAGLSEAEIVRELGKRSTVTGRDAWYGFNT